MGRAYRGKPVLQGKASQAGRQQAGEQAGQVRHQGKQAARSHESHPGMPDSRLYVPGGQTEHSLAF